LAAAHTAALEATRIAPLPPETTAAALFLETFTGSRTIRATKHAQSLAAMALVGLRSVLPHILATSSNVKRANTSAWGALRTALLSLENTAATSTTSTAHTR